MHLAVDGFRIVLICFLLKKTNGGLRLVSGAINVRCEVGELERI